jgi:hypothetical protein
LVIIDDRQPANLMFFHDIEHLFEASPGMDVIGVALGQLTCGRGVRVVPAGDAFDGI